MKNLRLVVSLLLIVTPILCYSTTYYAVADGNWSGNIWSTTPAGPGAALPALSDGDVIVVSNFTITVDVVYITTASITLNLISDSATIPTGLVFETGKKLSFGAGSNVFLSKNDPSYLDPFIDPGGGGGTSNLISSGGTNLWEAGNGPISGTGQLTGGALPVTLTEFSATINESKVELKWSTGSEINFDYFEVERSVNGESFSTLVKIQGHGTTFETHQYSFVDANPFIGKNYYRLRSVDFDGYTETFRVIGITYTGEKSLSIYPNPSSGDAINFKLNYVPEGGYIIVVYDNSGKVLTRLSPTEVSHAISLDQPLSSGVYFAKLITEDYVQVERFIVR